MDLRGKTVFITGAARGIGAESARRLAARGANVALAGLEPEELERVARQCGANAAWFDCDVTDWDALERAVEGAVERFGGVDTVVANAGIAPAGMTRSIDPRAVERTLEVNLLGVWRTVRVCLPQIIERQGYVLVIASLAAAVHSPGLAAYAASKAGAEAFADSLRVEVKHLGVDVGVGYFSWIDTDMVPGPTPTRRSAGCAASCRDPSARPIPSLRSEGRRHGHRGAPAVGGGARLVARAAGAADRARPAHREGLVRAGGGGRSAL
jgi:NAD(P)-dependent dehydrogenase (short-subunit alcohol dehydrogenase family)